MVLLCHGQSFNTCVDGISLSYCKVFFFLIILYLIIYFFLKSVCAQMHVLLEEVGWIYIYYRQTAYGIESVNGEERARGAVHAEPPCSRVPLRSVG